MDVSSREPNSETEHDQHPLLLDRMDRNVGPDHIVDISGNDDASSSSSHDDHRPPRINLPPHVDRALGSSVAPIYQSASSSTNRSNTRNSSFMRGEGYSRRRRSPLNSGLWISVELIVTLSQIIASVVVLSLSRNENPQAPLFAWVVGYASGCVAMLPVLFWRYRNRNQESQPDSIQPQQQSNPPELTSYTVISGNQALDEENNQTSETTPRNNAQSLRFLSSRLNGLVDHFKMTLDCFFAVWFVVGNVWIFGGHSSPSDAPKLYRLCIVFLTFSCIGYAMPFILCATICCCLPCIISVLGIREDRSQTRGATNELIDSLPTYKFKLKKDRNINNQELESGTSEGGILAAGTDKEREISGEDAACCICLARYADNDELRELPCSHVFHVECVDKWLKINATCPLCKAELGDSSDNSPTAEESGQ